MRLKVSSEIIFGLRACRDRYDNYVTHYGDKTFSLEKFLALDKISHSDKLWVILRLVTDDIKVVFALDCVFSAYAAYATADTDTAAAVAYAYATYAAYATAYTYTAVNASRIAAYATDAATDASGAAAAASADASTDARETEKNRQLESLIYLINGEPEDEKE